MAHTRVIKSGGNSDANVLIGIVIGAVTLGAFYGIIQLGHHFTAEGGGWIAGNPIQAGITWFTRGREWSAWHTILAAVVGLALFAVVFWWMDRQSVKAKQKDTTDYRARWLGRGKVMHRSVVQKAAVREGLTQNPEHFGLLIARTIPKNLSNLPTPKQYDKNPFIVPKGTLELFAGYRDSGTAIMGTGSGKTTAVALPMALEAPGSVFVTSNKPDIVAGLLGPRSAVGQVWTFDPQGVADIPPTWLWNPLAYLAGDAVTTSEVKSRQLAKQFAEAGRPLEAKTDAFFDPEGQEALANLMLACYASDQPITQAMRWARNPADETPLDILKTAGWDLPEQSLRGVYEMHDETRDSILGTARQMMRFLSNKGAAAWVERQGPNDHRPVFDPAEFVRAKSDTMICLSREGSGSFGPIVAALTVAVAEAGESYAKTLPKGRLQVPLVMVLDEVANVCRIKELPDWYSHFGGRGMFVFSILQSMAQGEAAWGKTGMEKLWGATVVRLIGRGIADVSLAKSISEMCDDIDVRRHMRSTSSGRGSGSRTQSENYTRERILSVGQITSLEKWRAIVLPAGEVPVLAQLIPWWERSPEMAAAVKASQDDFESQHVLVTV